MAKLFLILLLAVGPTVLCSAVQSSPEFAAQKLEAEKGDPKAQFSLGLAFATGDGVEKSNTDAAKWFRRAADQGNADGQYAIGEMYMRGLGVERNMAEAIRWWFLASNQGEPHAQTNLGAAFLNGQGVKKDYVEAFRWMSLGAEQNFAPAQAGLGSLYQHGQGVQANQREAVKWYRLAATQNDFQAINNLAWLQLTSDDPCIRDIEEALKTARKAAQLTNEQAPEILDTLARAYFENGNKSEAIAAEEKAAALQEKELYRLALKRYRTATTPSVSKIVKPGNCGSQ
jgi:TPR repeat protein